MAHVILDERDQKFVLYEMLGREKLCGHQRYADFSRETLDMILAETQKFAAEEILPTPKEAGKGAAAWERGRCLHASTVSEAVLRDGLERRGLPAGTGRAGPAAPHARGGQRPVPAQPRLHGLSGAVRGAASSSTCCPWWTLRSRPSRAKT